MIKAQISKRQLDSWGSGEFGAKRGDRKHNGIDYACQPDSLIYSPVAGEVTKLGYPYRDDLSFRYVQITSDAGLDYRVFYVEPCVEVGDLVTTDIIIGESQKLGIRYKGITEHVHLEIKYKGEFIDPEKVRV